MKLFLLLVMIISVQTSQAGDKGHGGYALVCYNSSKAKQVQMWDLFEGVDRGRVQGYSHLSTGFGSGHIGIIRSKIYNLKQYNQEFGNEVEKIAHKLMQAASNYEEKGLRRTDDVIFSSDFIEDVSDLENISYPANCEKPVQIAKWHHKEFPEDPSFQIRTTFWDSFDQLNKAALILHESIYKALSLMASPSYDKKTISSSARYLNQFLLSNKANDPERNDRFYLYTRVFKNIKVINLLIENQGFILYPDANIADSQELEIYSVPLGFFKFPEDEVVAPFIQLESLTSVRYIRISSSGNLKQGYQEFLTNSKNIILNSLNRLTNIEMPPLESRIQEYQSKRASLSDEYEALNCKSTLNPSTPVQITNSWQQRFDKCWKMRESRSKMSNEIDYGKDTILTHKNSISKLNQMLEQVEVSFILSQSLD